MLACVGSSISTLSPTHAQYLLVLAVIMQHMVCFAIGPRSPVSVQCVLMLPSAGRLGLSAELAMCRSASGACTVAGWQSCWLSLCWLLACIRVLHVCAVAASGNTAAAADAFPKHPSCGPISCLWAFWSGKRDCECTCNMLVVRCWQLQQDILKPCHHSHCMISLVDVQPRTTHLCSKVVYSFCWHGSYCLQPAPAGASAMGCAAAFCMHQHGSVSRWGTKSLAHGCTDLLCSAVRQGQNGALGWPG